jgi:ABC-type glycerol-3-phosphate transport system permease component
MAIETGIDAQKSTGSIPHKGGISRKHVMATVREVAAHLILLPMAFVFLLPFLWMISTSLKSKTQLYVFPPVWIPNPVEWINYPNTVVYVPFFN